MPFPLSAVLTAAAVVLLPLAGVLFASVLLFPLSAVLTVAAAVLFTLAAVPFA